jgi:hypothetical protein
VPERCARCASGGGGQIDLHLAEFQPVNFNVSDLAATGLASERGDCNLDRTQPPTTSGPHQDRLGAYPLSAPVAPIESILRPLHDNRRELT